jgi:aryl-alcohol dehydrogenase-like predicted oxidoreductase
MKLALGTVQFGLHYGVANSAGQVSPEQAALILREAANCGIDTLDTAVAYGNSEQRLGELGTAGWKLVTKLPAMPDAITEVEPWVESQVAGSLRRLGTDRLDALLLHRPAELLGTHGTGYRRALEKLKAQGLVGAVGYSIYAPAELDALCPFMKPDIVQAPFNIIDRRLLSSGWLDRLADMGARVHTRSAFMQGLLLMQADSRPHWFDRWRNLLDSWASASAEQGSALSLALGYAMSFAQIERVVVGVDTVEQLRQIIDAANRAMPTSFPDIQSTDPDLIEPSRWKLA